MWGRELITTPTPLHPLSPQADRRADSHSVALMVTLPMEGLERGGLIRIHTITAWVTVLQVGGHRQPPTAGNYVAVDGIHSPTHASHPVVPEAASDPHNTRVGSFDPCLRIWSTHFLKVGQASPVPENALYICTFPNTTFNSLQMSA